MLQLRLLWFNCMVMLKQAQSLLWLVISIAGTTMSDYLLGEFNISRDTKVSNVIVLPHKDDSQ